jgi:hypothetical protein
LAQIRGEVVDLTGAIIPKTTIRVLHTKSRKTLETAQTDATGSFDLRDLSPGQFTIVFSRGGFVPEMIDVHSAQAGSEIFRKIRLRAEDCDAPKVNCDSFSQVPISDPHPIVAEGDLTVGSSEAVDLDMRALVPLTASAANFRLNEDGGGLYLASLNRAKLLNVCVVLPGDSRKQREIPSIRVDGLSKNSEICMKTIRGRFSKLFFTRDVQPGDNQITVHVVTREK